MADTIDSNSPENEERRDFLNILSATTGIVGGGIFAWSVIDSMNPSQDVLALASVEVDISSIEVGQSVTVQWRGKPVFIRRRTASEIRRALRDDTASLPDRENDEDRTQRQEWLIVLGVCTHFGCVPLGQASGSARGDYDGWFCPCHGSHYDTSGRIRKGPAPKNLTVPNYEFLTDTLIKIG